MYKFEYYLRGKGELNTSNFGEIVRQGEIRVEQLDEKTFMSLLALNSFISQRCRAEDRVTVKVYGYVSHLRGDKDVFPVGQLYEMLDMLDIICIQVQHESTSKIKSGVIGQEAILYDLGIITPWYTGFLGADESVVKFFPKVNYCAKKVRENGKVVCTEFSYNVNHLKRIVIVDDILGGGATVVGLVKQLRENGFKGDLYLWTAYNEGIHGQDTLRLFRESYIGTNIHKKD